PLRWLNFPRVCPVLAWACRRSFASRLSDFRRAAAPASFPLFRPARDVRPTGVAYPMKPAVLTHRIAVAALAALLVVGLAAAQDTPQPAPQPAAATPAAAALSDALPTPPPPSVAGNAWLLMDYASGQVLAGENIDERVEPASITKVLTSYVIAAEMKAGKVKPDDQVMMSENAWRKGGAGTDGSYSGFPVNQTAPLLEMEKGMVVQSGNDAAIALAEHVAGSEEAFAALMNAYAKRIGMANSNFVNSHGLSEPE